ncbi:MAG: methyltransferase domain-containing protein [Candidatus Micrarchaeota archaeon]|nr:methyltransferase domain-containing protein [Candidatus Micrarchaeota archaeon]
MANFGGKRVIRATSGTEVVGVSGAQLAEDKSYWETQWRECPDEIRCYTASHLADRLTLRGATMLEIGCGDKNHEDRKLDGFFYGGDLAHNAVVSAKNAHPGAQFANFEATNMPFRNGSMDLVVAYEVILHLGFNTFKGLREMIRVARDGIAFTVLHEDSIPEHIASTHKPNKLHVVQFDECKAVMREKGGLRLFRRPDFNDMNRDTGLLFFNEQNIRSTLKDMGMDQIQVFLLNTDEDRGIRTIEEGSDARRDMMEVFAFKEGVNLTIG